MAVRAVWMPEMETEHVLGRRPQARTAETRHAERHVRRYAETGIPPLLPNCNLKE
ncbi:hypothetical protein OBV_40700 [Oscillibacter valericigenes Sjm18-20]|nr:hypothetical protein OBV_40700 [Oscillibacter valericigenes Sjm18-20]